MQSKVFPKAQEETAEQQRFDPELEALAADLRETASYAINHTFKEKLRKDLLKKFAAHWVGEEAQS